MSTTFFIVLAVCILLYLFHRSVLKAEWEHKYNNYLKITKDNPVMSFDQFKQYTEDYEL